MMLDDFKEGVDDHARAVSYYAQMYVTNKKLAKEIMECAEKLRMLSEKSK